MSSTSSEAEDLAKHTVLTAFQTMASFDGDRSHTRAWLFGTALDAAVSRGEHTLDRLTGPDHTLESMRSQPQTYGIIVDLVDVETMRYQEVADLLAIPVHTVMSRLHHARDCLRGAGSTSP